MAEAAPGPAITDDIEHRIGARVESLREEASAVDDLKKEIKSEIPDSDFERLHHEVEEAEFLDDVRHLREILQADVVHLIDVLREWDNEDVRPLASESWARHLFGASPFSFFSAPLRLVFAQVGNIDKKEFALALPVLGLHVPRRVSDHLIHSFKARRALPRDLPPS